MAEPYPLRFQPCFRDYLWGGRNLAARLGKPLPPEGVWAESWEVVDHAEHNSVVAHGHLAGKTLGQLVREDAEWLLGPSAGPSGVAATSTSASGFPLLLKYLDCQRVLSVQVHPDDEYGATMSPPDLGKTEAWYIIHAEPGSVIYAGLKPGVDRATLSAAIASGRTEDCLHQIEAKAGDCIFIPAGTVHALGAGLIVAEIQQASNTTFRLFDWNRVDSQGKSRPLHVEQSLETIDFDSGPRAIQVPEAVGGAHRQRLVTCDKFVFDRVSGTQSEAIGGDDRFHILTVPTGSAKVIAGSEAVDLQLGETVLLPASLGRVQVELSPGAVLLDMTMP